ncbi:chorion-specific transcription factor GCMa-like [Watersipora subatra]|uniref:chorion-specific transcription factor GCMa-like n=1 Tax=Watersipora subatra TaxID=2589382 RepID=UPI00355ADCAC
MNYKHKKLLIWDLKELDSFSPQSLTVEPFNMWPAGNCSHIYSASQTQARRHISGWAMRNTNNHNINILKKSCLGVLVCSRRCRRSDSSVVAVRPAICDKARRKQIGKKCPNACGGVLVMQQCKGHSGYPVTHFWRHHEDKVFFLGKGHHDHPKPELKLCAEKRKAYIRVQTGRRPAGSGNGLSKPRLTTSETKELKTCPKIGADMYGGDISEPFYSPKSVCYSTPSSYSYTMQLLQNQPLTVTDCDLYIPPISNELPSSSSQPHLFYEPTTPQISESSNYYGAAANPITTDSFTSWPGTSASFANTQNFLPPSYQTGPTILDLSRSTPMGSLDTSWQIDPPASKTYSPYSYNRNENQFLTSSISTSNKVIDRSFLETSKVSTFTEKTYQTRIQERIQERKEVDSFKLHALWDCINPADEPRCTPASFYNTTTTASSLGPTSSSAEEFTSAPLKDVLNFDDLDMGDISNILTIPAQVGEVNKPVASFSAAAHSTSTAQASQNRQLETQMEQVALLPKPRLTERDLHQSGILPNLSSFFEEIDYP